jgi:amidohydrolase
MTHYSAEAAAAMGDQIIQWRRLFHQYPELGFQEFNTASVVAAELRSLGLEVMTGIARTGVVGTLGEGKPVVAIRADMDALPITEATGAPYASQRPGVMHACGHDAHTAILLGVARMLAHMPDRPPGEVRFLFQPCEETVDDEGKSGARRMVEEGALNGVDRVIALHVASEEEAGRIVIEDGFITATADDFFATIHGKGAHAAHPDQGIDPIFIAAQVINAIHGVRARRIDPIRPAVITIGQIHGGTTENVIPDAVTLTGTIRAYHEDTRQLLWRELENALAVSRALGGDYHLRIVTGCPATYNDPTVAATIRSAAADLFGAGSLLRRNPSMGGEDFSYMTNTAPGAMFMLGAKRDAAARAHHNPLFDLDEPSFTRGAALLAETTVRLMRELGR